MGKLGSIIATAVFMVVFAMFVYYCCLNKRRRDGLRNRAQSFFRQAESTGEVQHPPQVVHSGGGGYPSSVPHSIVNLNQPYSSPYPAPQHQPYPPVAYPGSGYGGPHQTAPYPPGPPGGMPMPIAYDHRQMAPPGFQDPSAPVITYPDDLPPPYSQIVGGQKY